MSKEEDKAFVINYRVLKEIDNARKKGITIEDIDAAIACMSTNILNVKEELQKEDVDWGEVQEMLINHAAATIMISIDMNENSARLRRVTEEFKCAIG